MTKMILGLGNPGAEYSMTRHNVGFAMLDAFAKERGLTWTAKPKLKALIAEYSQDGEKVLLVKPQTFYNLAGECAQLVKNFYKIDNQDSVVVHDELALPFGTVRTRGSGSDAGNNGIKSLNQHIGSDTARIRIGISAQQEPSRPAEIFVLEKFSASELKKIDLFYKKVDTLIQDFILKNHTFNHTTERL